MRFGKIYPRDVIAVVLIIAMCCLKAAGLNGHVDMAIVLVCGFYFAQKYEKENGKSN